VTMTRTVSSGPIRLMMVDDHPVVLHGLRQLLPESRFRVVAEATTSGECVSAAVRTTPDVILLDLRLQGSVAPDTCRDLRRAGVTAKVVILTGFEDEALLRACMAEGVSGILLKDSHETDLGSALERVIAGETVLDHRLTSKLSPDRADAEASRLGITAREYEVLRLLAQGLTSAEIGRELFLSVNTIRSYVQSLLAKLGAHTRIEAVTTARRHRLI
jgi:two-component system nitrate/nitrite response regulator NarL